MFEEADYDTELRSVRAPTKQVLVNNDSRGGYGSPFFRPIRR